MQILHNNIKIKALSQYAPSSRPTFKVTYFLYDIQKLRHNSSSWQQILEISASGMPDFTIFDINVKQSVSYILQSFNF